MPLSHDEVGHFRHVLHWHPTSDENYSIACTYSSTTPVSVSVTSGTSDTWERMIWTLAGAEAPGEGMMSVFSTYANYIGGAPDKYVLEPASDTDGAAVQIVATGTATNTWTFVKHGTAYEIRRTGTTLCMTAGTYASSSTMSTLALTNYSGAANQLWTFTISERTQGVYSIRPAAATNLALAMPGGTTAVGAQAGLFPVDETDQTQPCATYHSRMAASGSTSDLIHVLQARDVPNVSWPARGYHPDDWDALYAGVGLCVQWRGLTASDFFASRISSTNAWKYDASTTYMARQLEEAASLGAQALDSSGISGTENLSNLVYFRQELTSTGADAIAQYWLSIPQNVYASSLATPYDMRIRVIDQSTLDEQELTGAGYVDGAHTLSIEPTFVLPDNQETLTATMRIRYRSSDGTWGDWGQVYTTMSALDATLATGPQSIPGGGAAWIPTAFVATDTHGRKTLTHPFEVAGLFAGHSDAQAAQVSVSVRAFVYTNSGMYAKPVVGPAATQVITLARTPQMRTSGTITGGPSGIIIPYEVDEWTPGTTLSLRSVSHISAGDICDEFTAEVPTASGVITIPWTAMRALSLDVARGTGAITIYGAMTSTYGSVDVLLAGSLGPEAGGTATTWTQTATPHDFFTDAYISRTGDKSAYMLSATEHGPRVIEVPVVSDHVIALPPCADHTGLIDATTTATCLAFVTTSGSNDYATATFAATRATRGIASIAYEGASDVIIIPIEGSAKHSYAAERDYAAARTIGGAAFHVGALPGYASSISLDGTLYRDQLASRDTSATGVPVRVVATIPDAFQIPANARCIYRSAYGTLHHVRVVSISMLRSIEGIAELSIEMVEEV